MTTELINQEKKESSLSVNIIKQPVGFELAVGYDKPSFGKVIQQMTGSPFKPPFNEGDLIIVPDSERIITKDEIFHFAPVFFYPEFCIHNPREGKLEWIREKTLDPTSDLAKRAKSSDPTINSFPCPENPKYDCKYTQHLNFVIVLLDHDEAIGDTPIVLTFHRGEFQRGSKIIKLVKARKIEHIFACRLQASISLRITAKGQWYGLDIINPEDGICLVDEDRKDQFYELYKSIYKTYKERGIDIDYDASSDDITIDGTVISEKF
jgi:hypothetical protein